MPLFYKHKAGTSLNDYLAIGGNPLHAFGYEISFATFENANLNLSVAAIKPNGKITVSVAIKNTGRRDAAKALQLFIKNKISTTE